MSSTATITIQYSDNNHVHAITFSPEGNGSVKAQSIYDILNTMQDKGSPKSEIDEKLNSLIQEGEIRILNDTYLETVFEVLN